MSSALRRAVARDFPGPAAVAAAPGHRAHLRGYLADLAAPYRVALREPMFDDACGQSYGEMAATLLAEVLPPDEAVDLLVLAFAVPDIRPGRSTATYLSHICPGRPLAFAICDQGAAAGFTGLRLILSYARDRERRRAVLLVVEQAALHYEPAGAAPLPAGHTGVALLTGADGPVRLGEVRQHTAVTPAAARALLRAESAGPGVLLAGAGLAALDPAAPGLRAAPAGRPYTGVWAELPAALAAGAGRITLAEYDARLGYFCVSTLERQSVTEPGGGACDAARSGAVELGAT